MAQLEVEGDLKRVKARVDREVEISQIIRREIEAPVEKRWQEYSL
jgi:3-polyprenyl-4-hydroxybenzoate decarboxylase